MGEFTIDRSYKSYGNLGPRNIQNFLNFFISLSFMLTLRYWCDACRYIYNIECRNLMILWQVAGSPHFKVQSGKFWFLTKKRLFHSFQAILTLKLKIPCKVFILLLSKLFSKVQFQQFFQHLEKFPQYIIYLFFPDPINSWMSPLMLLSFVQCIQ